MVFLKMRKWLPALAMVGIAGVAHAENSEERAFLTANILGIFYHEFGHAVIDIEDVPIFGQEEDAVDVFSVFLIDSVFEADIALQLAYDAAFGFAGEADWRDATSEEIAWWDVHRPDKQRFYNTVCIFYGADPDDRKDFAEELGLPEERADYCPDEFAQAENAWGGILDRMAEYGSGESIQFGGGHGIAGEILKGEVAALNAEFKLSRTLKVEIEECSEANAFYDPGQTKIIFCEECTPHLIEWFKNR